MGMRVVKTALEVAAAKQADQLKVLKLKSALNYNMI
jgi:hypothetical protein